MSKDTKKQKQISVRPSVVSKGKTLNNIGVGSSFSDLVEILINEKHKELELQTSNENLSH